MSRVLFAAILSVSIIFSAPVVAREISSDFLDVQESFVVPEFRELIQTMIALGGMDPKNEVVADEYMRLMYCNLYDESYGDDFKWHTLRERFVKTVISRQAYYRTFYEVGGVIELGKYDFRKRLFPLAAKTILRDVGLMSLYRKKQFKPYCDWGDIDGLRFAYDDFLPKNYSVALIYPFNFTAINMSQENAQQFLEKLEILNGDDRRLYTRYRFRIHSVKEMIVSRFHPFVDKVIFSGELISADLFYDEDHTMWVARIPVR